jgi:hypothetical protein
MPPHPLCGQTSKLRGQGGCEEQKFAVGAFRKEGIDMMRQTGRECHVDDAYLLHVYSNAYATLFVARLQSCAARVVVKGKNLP